LQLQQKNSVMTWLSRLWQRQAADITLQWPVPSDRSRQEIC